VTQGKTSPSKGRKKQSRRERIAEIKARVDAGTYVVDPREVSRKIIDAHITNRKTDH
jgi:anti-sigma28 factor (negative regulator of flagellin synthesis)